MKKIDIKYLLSILFPLIVGAISSLFSSAGMQNYRIMAKPPLSPPAVVFPIAWTILYILMGSAMYLVGTSDIPTEQKRKPIFLYLLQLGMNFFWSIIFFGLGMYLFALIWLIAMFVIIILCTAEFFSISPKAGWIMVPYNVWMAFALYLNTAIVIMNK